MDIQESFGLRCKELRESAQMSQERFALMINMDRTYYSSIENGKRNVSIKNIEKIANGFHITFSELFEGVKTNG